MHTWHKGLKLPPKTLQNFSLLLANHHPASKDSLARWVKEVMGNSGIDTEIFKPHSTRVASNSAAYKLGMPLQEVLKRGQWSNAGTFSIHTILEKSRTCLMSSSIGDGRFVVFL